MYRQIHTYERVASCLAAEITSGRWEAGARLPGENALAQQFRVARGTIRQALALLRSRQIVTMAQQGSGTFVTFDKNVLAFEDGFSHALRRHHIDVTTTVLRRGVVIRDANLARKLGMGTDRFIAFDRRRNLADGTLISLERSRIPVTGDTWALAGVDLTRQSLVRALEDRAGMVASWQELEVDAAPLPVEPHLFEGEASPDMGRMLRLTRILRQHDGHIVEFVQSWLNPDHFTVHTDGPLGETIKVRAQAGERRDG